jgi:branched-chain amino acid transport system permease protein
MMDSIWMLGMLIVGGMGSIMGAILGTAFIMLVNEATVVIAPIFSSIFPIFTAAAFAALGMGAKGVVIALFLIYEPRGINHRWQIFKSSYRLFPFSN